MSCKKEGFLSPKNIPDIEGVTPTIIVDDEITHKWWTVSIWKYICSSNDIMICSGEGFTLRIAKKKAFKEYRTIIKQLEDKYNEPGNHN